MALASSLLALALLSKQAAAQYELVATFDSSNFFDDFSFFTGADPTGGFVDYLDESAASAAGLINTNNGQIYLGVDYTTYDPADGRASVRLTSNSEWTHGLWIADIAHMPGSICGVWPAYWLFGPNWPDSGEIDVIEGVNLAGTDSITLHTSAGCSINIASSLSGTTLSNSNCNAGDASTGCGVTTTTPNAYGNAFNDNGGGVYAMQWEASGVYVWFFPSDAIPADITDGAPATTDWGLPIVAFNGGSDCDIDDYFANLNIVFDTTFCGDVSPNSSR